MTMKIVHDIILLTITILSFIHEVHGQGVNISTWMVEMLNAVNQERVDEGLAALCYNDKLILTAQVHNQDMVNNNFFSHTGSDDSAPWDRMTEQGYTWTAAAENIAWGQTSVDSVMNAWMNSSGHRKNILSSRVYHFGAAWDTSTNKWTQVFGNSRSEDCISVSTSAPASTSAPVPATPAPVPSSSTTPAPVPSCTDRAEKWRIDSNRRKVNWCVWAKKRGPKKVSKRCARKSLHADCPKTCGACTR